MKNYSKICFKISGPAACLPPTDVLTCATIILNLWRSAVKVYFFHRRFNSWLVAWLRALVGCAPTRVTPNFLKINSFETGQSLVEILLAVAIAGLIMPALATGLVASRQGRVQHDERIAAVAILRETQDAIRVVREAGWTTIPDNGVYHPAKTSTSWTLVPNPETVGDFTRSVTISDIYRDENGTIVEIGGSIDPSSKKITVLVSWNIPQASEITSTFYITRYLENASFVQTTEAEFNAGTKAGVAVVNSNGGEVVLAQGGAGDWCNPNGFTVAELDLPKSGVANALSAISGQAFAGTGDNASGVSFANIAVSNTSPPVPSVVGTFDGFKTNGIFGETNYAYLATDNNTKEVVILDISHSPYTESGYFNAPIQGNGSSVATTGNSGFMTIGNKLYSFDLSSKSGSRPQLGVVTLDGTGKKIFIVGNYAYVVIDGTPKQLDIVDITNPSSLSIVASASVAGSKGVDVFVNQTGTRAYLVTEASTQNNFFIIDTTTKSGNLGTINSYKALNITPKGVALVPGGKAIMVGGGTDEYQVLNVSTESSITRCNTNPINVTSGINGIAAVLEPDGDAYSYIITGDSSAEFKIIEGGPGGKYFSSGTFESSTFDPGYATGFNRISAVVNEPSQTSINLQVGVTDAISGSCANVNFTYLGPDGTGSTFFTPSGGIVYGVIPYVTNGDYKNPARCFSYKAYLSTQDFNLTPTLYDVTVNYSP